MARSIFQGVDQCSNNCNTSFGNVVLYFVLMVSYVFINVYHKSQKISKLTYLLQSIQSGISSLFNHQTKYVGSNCVQSHNFTFNTISNEQQTSRIGLCHIQGVTYMVHLVIHRIGAVCPSLVVLQIRIGEINVFFAQYQS